VSTKHHQTYETHEESEGPAMKAKTFKEGYAVLNRHAETLRTQQEPNIDDLLMIVTESVAAYQVCKERIDAVEAALQKALSGVDAPAGAAKGAAPARPAPTAPPGEMSDDIPF
jgi:exodeoxyribonuclease VII small subunit